MFCCSLKEGQKEWSIGKRRRSTNAEKETIALHLEAA